MGIAEIELIVGREDDPRTEQATHVICRAAVPREELPDTLKDNVSGPCSGCGKELMWRPSSPDKPKICMACAAGHVVDHMIAANERRQEEQLVSFIEKLAAEVGLTAAPAVLAELVNGGLPRIPQPGEPGHEGFREGAAFAISLLFEAFRAEQTGGALVDLSKRHRDAVAVLLYHIDCAVTEALGEEEGEAAPAEQ
jgi:hypothetical protein